MDLDAVVIGGGPAGLAAATWLGRYRRRTLVVDSGDYRNRFTELTHGFLGRDPVPPMELLGDARRDLQQYDTVEYRSGRVTRLVAEDAGRFTVELDGGRRTTARRVVLATGVDDTFPEVGNFWEHYGASVFHCPSCDGYEARDQHIVAFGWNPHVTAFALELLDWAASVTLVTDGRRFEGDDQCREVLDRHGIALLEDDAVEFLGTRGELQGVRLRSGRTIPCALAFFSIVNTPRLELADQLGLARTGEGCIDTDAHGETSVPGVYAAGDMTPGPQLAIVAAAKGTIAGVACAMSLYGERPVGGAPAPAPDPAAELGAPRQGP